MTVSKITFPASVIMAGSVGRQTIGSLGSSEDSTNGSLKNPTFSERHPKVVRSLTVVAYVFCVSLVAILLSAYYVLLWSPEPQKPESESSLQGNSTPCRGVTFTPDGEYIHRLPFSRYKHSSQSVLYRLPSRTPPPPQLPFIPTSSKLVSVEHSNVSHHHHHNPSLQQQEKLSRGANRVGAAASGEQQRTSLSHSGTVEQTTSATLSAPPTPKSIIIQKLLTNKKIFDITR